MPLSNRETTMLKVDRWFRYFKNMPKRIRRLSNKSTLYGAALWIGISSIGIRTASHFLKLGWTEFLTQLMLTTSATLLILALLYDLIEWSKRLTVLEQSFIGKILLAGIITAAGAFSLSRAASIINSFTGIAENPLTYTTTLLGVPSTVILAVVILMTIYILLAFHIFSSTLIVAISNIRSSLPFMQSRNRRLHSRRTRLLTLNLLRFSACFILIFIMIEISQAYIHGLTWLGRNFAFAFELKSKDPCALPGEKLIRVNDEVILTARTPDLFEARRCAIGTGLAR